MTISINGVPVHRVDLLHVPCSGSWTLEIAYAADVAPSGVVTIQWGSATFVGTVDPSHAGVFTNEARAKIVGGFGWATELPAAWHQSDNPGVRGRTLALKVAEAVGETLYGSTGQTQPNESVFRPLRVSYSQARQTGALVLRNVLATGQTWWTDFDGTTRAGVRMAPSPSPRVVLLDYDAGSQWADLECDDPSNLIGTTIPADGVRGTPALVVNELFAWSEPDGALRYRAAVLPAPAPEYSRFVEALRALVRGLVPELPALELRRARVTSQSSDGRVSVQQVDRAGKVADFGRNEGAVRLYTGLPGASADLDTDNTPETVLAFCRADWSDPIAFLAPAVGQPGHVPLVVRLEAADNIDVVGASNGVVRVGPTPTTPVALATDLVAYLNAVEEWAAQTDVFLAVVAAAAMVPVPPPPAPYPDAIAARAAAAGNIGSIPATRLEAK